MAGSVRTVISDRSIQNAMLGAILFVAFIALYTSTRSQILSYDSLFLASSLENGEWYFHPHHLLFQPLARLAYQLWMLIGTNKDAIVSTQLLNAILAAGGVVGLFWAIERLAGSSWAAVLGAMGFGLSKRYWGESVQAEYYGVAVGLLAVAFLCGIVCCSERPSTRLVVMAAVANTLATLVHQSYFLLAPAVLVVLLGPSLLRRPFSRSHLSRALGLGLLYCGLLAGLVGTTYLVVGVGLQGIRTPVEFLLWITSYAGIGDTGSWNKGPALSNLPILLMTWKESMLASGSGSFGAVVKAVTGDAYDLAEILHGLALVVLTTGIIVGTAIGGTIAYRRCRIQFLAIVLYVMAFGGFTLWWNPGYAASVLPLLVPTWVLCGLAVGRLAQACSMSWVRACVVFGCFALIGFLAEENAFTGEAPSLAWSGRGGSWARNSIVFNMDLNNDPLYHLTRLLSQVTKEGDLILVPPVKSANYLGRYFGRPGAFSLYMAIEGAQPRPQIERALANTKELMAQTEARNGHIIASLEELVLVEKVKGIPLDTSLAPYVVCQEPVLSYNEPLVGLGLPEPEGGKFIFVEISRQCPGLRQ